MRAFSCYRKGIVPKEYLITVGYKRQLFLSMACSCSWVFSSEARECWRSFLCLFMLLQKQLPTADSGLLFRSPLSKDNNTSASPGLRAVGLCAHFALIGPLSSQVPRRSISSRCVFSFFLQPTNNHAVETSHWPCGKFKM